MKVTCKRQMLSAAFAAVSGVVPTKTPKSVLTNTRIEAEHGQLTLLATDGDLSIRYVIHEAEIEEPGTVLLPTLRTLNILRELDGDSVTIETLEHNVRIRTDRADYKLGLENPDLFPAVAHFQEENYHVIDARVFRQLIRRTVFAVDTESTRYALGGGADRPAAGEGGAGGDRHASAVGRRGSMCGAGGAPGDADAGGPEQGDEPDREDSGRRHVAGASGDPGE